jgi:hypothetical protein
MNDHDKLRARIAVLEAALPRTPTEPMLIAARDWSQRKYGKAIGNDAASGCWQAMLDAALQDKEQSPLMRAAENAAEVVKDWSDAKREYADRILQTKGETT